MSNFTTTALNERVGVQVPTKLLIDLGFTPAEKGRAGHPLWAASDFASMCEKMAAHFIEVSAGPLPEAKGVTMKPGAKVLMTNQVNPADNGVRVVGKPADDEDDL